MYSIRFTVKSPFIIIYYYSVLLKKYIKNKGGNENSVHPKLFSDRSSSEFMADMYIFVTQRLVVFDRTAGRNERLRHGKAYPLESGGSVVFMLTDGGHTRLRRLSADNVLVYEKDLVESGMYSINKQFIRKTSQSAKITRAMNTRIRQQNFASRITVVEWEDQESPVRVVIKIKSERYLYTPEYVIFVKPSLADYKSIDHVVDLFKKIEKIEMGVIIYDLGYLNNGGATVELTEDFIKMAEIIQQRDNAQEA
ncbi:hypothetical protein D3C73_893600 [compost metagenome]